MDKEELEKLFDTCDVTGKGHLDKNEFARLCQELSLKDDELQALFGSVDINKDGIIQKSEFVEKFYVVADLFFSAMNSCDASADVTNDHCNDDVMTNHCDVSEHSDEDISLSHCASDSFNKSYFNDVTQLNDVTLYSDCDVITPLPKSARQNVNALANESSFMATPPSGDPPKKRTSTPRPGAIGGRVSRSGRFKVAKSDRSWDSFAGSLGNLVYTLPSYDSISSLYKQLSESGDRHVINSYEAMLQQLLKVIENMQVSITELEASLQRVTEKSSEQLSILEEEMEAQINLKERKAREEERERADEEARKLRMEYEERISRLQQAVHKLKQVDERLSKVSPLENEVEKLRDKLREVSSENASLTLRLSEAETQGVLLKTQVADLQVKLQEKRIIVDRESDVVRQVWSEREAMAQQVQSLTSDNRKLRDSNDDLREVAYKRLSGPFPRSPSASFNGEFLSPYSSAAASRMDFHPQSGRSSRASCESEMLAFCDPKLSSIISEEDDVSHDDDTEADFSFKSSVDGTTTLVTNGYERDSGIGTIRGEHDSDTEVDGTRGYRPRNPANRTSFGSGSPFSSPHHDSPRRSIIGGVHDIGYGDATDEDNDAEDVPSVEKRKRYDRRRGSVERMSKRKITPSQPLVVGELYKIILCGDMGVGKSSFIFRTCKDEFNRHPRSTLGVDFQSKTLMLDSQQVVTLQLWDTAGQERFRSIAASYFRRADGVILVYDVTNQSTFLNVKEWMETISHSAPEDTPVMICGNKVDLRDKKIEIMRDAVYQKEGAQLAADYGVLFMECSAASGLNVLTAVTLLARHLVTKKRSQTTNGSIKDLTTIPPKESKCCFKN